MDFARLFQLVSRHKWLLLAVIITATAGTWFGARLKGATYQANATLMPQEQALQTLEGVAALSSSLGGQSMERVPLQFRSSRVKSLIALMLSPRVLGQLIAKLKLDSTPAELEEVIEIEQVTPEVLRVRATARSPELAAALANGLASTFVQFYGDLSTTAISESTKLLTEQESEARRDLEQSTRAVQKYKATRKISSLSEQLTGVMTRLNAVRQAREGTVAQLAELGAQLRELETRLASTPAVLRAVEKTNDSPAAAQLRNEMALLERDLALELGVHTDQHPKVRELEAKLASASVRLRREEGRLIERLRYSPNPAHATLQDRCGDLRAQRDGLEAKIVSYASSVRLLEQELQGYTGADIQLANLMQRFTAAEQRYSSVSTRLRQAEANADSIRRSSAIAIVDTAGPMNPPTDISAGKTAKLTVTAFMLSFALTVFILAAWDYLDRRVRTTTDAEALVELPVVAIIPRALPAANATALARSSPTARLASLVASSPEGEAYRFLGLHLLLSRQSPPMRVLMMATAKPSEGATTTISNLAVTLAQANQRVILVDADLRRPSLHALFELENNVGLTSLLNGEVDVTAVLQPTQVPNLALLPGGPIVDNPWALLRSGAMEAAVSRLRQMADFVLIDTPSASAFADAFHVAPMVDGVFMVVRARHQPTGIELKIKRMFEEAGARVFGAVLNDVPMGNVESCRYHKHYYGNSSRVSSSTEAPALPAGR